MDDLNERGTTVELTERLDRQTFGNANHLMNQIDARRHFSDRMFDLIECVTIDPNGEFSHLKTRVHFQEVEISFRIDHELDGTYDGRRAEVDRRIFAKRLPAE